MMWAAVMISSVLDVFRYLMGKIKTSLR